jgi:hypothetical protein
MRVSDHERMLVATVVPNSTWAVPWVRPNWLPEIVMGAPGAALVGLSEARVVDGPAETVTVAAALVTPRPEAVICAEPAATAPTPPLASTVATDVAEELQVKLTPCTTAP